MSRDSKLTKERVMELFDYDKDSGSFVRKSTRGSQPQGNVAGFVDRKGYVVLSIDNKLHRAHRIAWLVCYGEMPVGQIDHINKVKADNRISNLRQVSDAQNKQNRDSASSRSSSGILGVCWHKKTGMWVAKIQVNGVTKSLGYYKDTESAKAAYLAAKRELHPFWANSPNDASATQP